MKYIVTINDKSYEVEVEKGQASIVKTTQAAAVPVQKDFPTSSAVEETKTADTAKPHANVSGEPLRAPMPGTIVAVTVQPGIEVKQGDVLFILEAMKMESEIIASRDGVISEIMVTKGASVSTGDILLTLE
ncbi:MAG TPA: biotin/lipoyl-binding protein [Syntrophomonadaceae bacterium]|nr:biotin/lipoyl-binding protein [Syntrophomonadaceae bacterium]